MRFIPLPRTLLTVIALALALLPGGVGQAAPAGQGRSWNYKATLTVRMEDSPLCANRDYPVTVVPVKNLDSGLTDYTPPKMLETIYKPIIGAVIEASSQDKSVATIRPAKLPSGWDVDDPVPGAATFTLHTGKAGSTNVMFEAFITKTQLGGTTASGQYVGPVIPIKVINCKYKVTMTFRAAGGTGGYDSRDVGKIEGQIVGDSSGNLKGTANQGYWDMHAFSSCCSHSISSNSLNADLSGTLSADGTSLSLHADFSPVSATDTSKSRPIPIVGSITGTSTANLQVPPLDVDLPASGGWKVQVISIPFGELSLQVSVVISATPIKGQ